MCRAPARRPDRAASVGYVGRAVVRNTTSAFSDSRTWSPYLARTRADEGLVGREQEAVDRRTHADHVESPPGPRASASRPGRRRRAGSSPSCRPAPRRRGAASRSDLIRCGRVPHAALGDRRAGSTSSPKAPSWDAKAWRRARRRATRPQIPHREVARLRAGPKPDQSGWATPTWLGEHDRVRGARLARAGARARRRSGGHRRSAAAGESRGETREQTDGHERLPAPPHVDISPRTGLRPHPLHFASVRAGIDAVRGRLPVSSGEAGTPGPRASLMWCPCGSWWPRIRCSCARASPSCWTPRPTSRSSHSARTSPLLAAVEVTEPDVVLTDIRMPPTGTDEGIRAAASLREHPPGRRRRRAVAVRRAGLRPRAARRRIGGPGLPAEGAGVRRRPAGRRHPRGGRRADRSSTRRWSRCWSRPRPVRPPARSTVSRPARSRCWPRSPRARTTPPSRASLVLSERAVEKHINSLFSKLGLSEEPDVHRRVKAVLLYLADARGG